MGSQGLSSSRSSSRPPAGEPSFGRSSTCGILDPAASILGRKGAAVLLDCATLDYRLVQVPEEVGLLVVDSGVERSLENTAYAERKAELERALELVGAETSACVEPADLAHLDPVSLRRLRHVVTENERVERFAEALERGNLATCGALLVESHASLRDDYEVSIPELDTLVELAVGSGACGARLSEADSGEPCLPSSSATGLPLSSTRSRSRTGRAAIPRE